MPVSHARLLAAHDSWAEVIRPTPEDRHLITAGPALTAFAAGWTRALCSGGALVVPERAPWKPDKIRQAIDSDQVSVVHTDPVGAARLLLRDPGPAATTQPSVPRARREADPELRSLRLLTVTGARFHLDEQAALQDRLRTGVRLLNVYGLTETAGTGAWFELPQLPGPVDDPERFSLIGTPFPGCRVDLRDGEVRLAPPDGGDAIPTGDLARLRDDGLLEFGGRIRDRITVDGRTLDPHPLESVIRGHEGIGSALVAAVPGFQGFPAWSPTSPRRPPTRHGPRAPACRTSTSSASTWRAGCPPRTGPAPWCGCASCPRQGRPGGPGRPAPADHERLRGAARREQVRPAGGPSDRSVPEPLGRRLRGRRGGLRRPDPHEGLLARIDGPHRRTAALGVPLLPALPHRVRVLRHRPGLPAPRPRRMRLRGAAAGSPPPRIWPWHTC